MQPTLHMPAGKPEFSSVMQTRSPHSSSLAHGLPIRVGIIIVPLLAGATTGGMPPVSLPAVPPAPPALLPPVPPPPELASSPQATASGAQKTQRNKDRRLRIERIHQT